MIARSARGLAWTLGLALLTVSGCGIGPRTFKDLQNPAPIVRARAAGLGREVPASVAVPALIDRLEDPDGVVRMSACEALRKRIGQDFGYVPWADPSERASAVARWRTWWQSQSQSQAQAPQAGLANSRRRF
ncbi:hypothetical protein BH23PLA1_BH23PLA1_26120 [soil metagenome]